MLELTDKNNLFRPTFTDHSDSRGGRWLVFLIVDNGGTQIGKEKFLDFKSAFARKKELLSDYEGDNYNVVHKWVASQPH